MALEALQATMFTCDLKVIDMYLAKRVPAAAQCLLHDDMIARARLIGEHIMQSLNTPVKERGWLGEEDMGWCPNCHSNALILGELQWDGLHFPIECQVCGAGGTLKQDAAGRWQFMIQEDGLCRDRTSVEGRAHHLREIGHTQGGFYSDPANRQIISQKIERYRSKQFKAV